MSRLKSADYGDRSSGSSTYFDVSGLTYDGAGNITGLQRNDETGSLIDDLGYSYQSGTNRLGSINDAAGQPTSWDAADATFGYDENGNLASQSGKLDNIAYDHRNLPVQFSLATNDTVIANYNADGQRILKESSGGAWQFYVMDGQQTLAVIDNNGFSHFNLVGNEVFGRYTDSGARRYYITDHLGSTRAVVDNNGTVLETFDYYPFGLLMPKRNTAGANTIEKFTGHELDSEANLNLFYAGARYLDPALGRWTTYDPLADDPAQVDKSSYAYAWKNPVNLTDPDGQCPVCPWLDAAVDAAFIAYDVGKLAYDKVTTGTTKGEDWAALSADVASVFVPMSVGTGMAARASFKAAKGFSISGKTLSKFDIAEDAVKITKGSSDNVAIIGEGMGRVTGLADELGKSGVKNLNTFSPSKSAMKQWNELTKGGKQLSDDAVKNTKLFKENQQWIKNVKESGATIIDIGSQKGRNNPSTFYKMEKKFIYDGN